MPAVVFPDDVNSQLAALWTAVRQLQNSSQANVDQPFDPRGVPLYHTVSLAATANGGLIGPFSFTTSWTNIPGVASPSFTVTSASQRIMVLPTILFVTNGGTANYGYCQGVILNGSGAVVANSRMMECTNGAGKQDSCHPFNTTLAPGTYTAAIQYEMNAGATTTLTVDAWELDVLIFG